MTTTAHQHKCSLCGALWEHEHACFHSYGAHICRSCGFLETLVYQPGAPTLGPADHPQVVANLLKAVNDPDPAVRVAVVSSLSRLGVEPHRVVPALVRKLNRDPARAVREAAVNGLRRFGLETCQQVLGLGWVVIASAFNVKGAVGQPEAR
jgi:hypothetical protein